MKSLPILQNHAVHNTDCPFECGSGTTLSNQRPGKSESDASHIAVTGLSVHSSIATKSEATMTRKKGVPRRAGALVATSVDWESGTMKYRDTVPAWITENSREAPDRARK